MKPKAIVPALTMGQVVSHITDEDKRGVVTAFMVRGANHSYEVRWGIEKDSWHLDFELLPSPDPPKQIGFWPAHGTPPRH